MILIVHRPGDAIGGDIIAARAYGEALEGIGVGADVVAADDMGPISGYDWVHLWSANAPGWALPVAEAVKRQGGKLIITPNWWSRAVRQEYYGYLDQDVIPGYTGSVARVLSMADILFVCTMSEAQQCWHLAPFKRVYWFGHGCDDAGGAIAGDPGDYVTCLARIEPHKNQVNLAMACRELGKPLRLVGSISDPAYWAQAKALGAERVEVEDREGALDILARARVHALPSFFETPGMSNMEAAVLGVPAVLGSLGAEIEFFGGGGIYADPRHWRQIAQAIVIAWEQPRQQWADIPTWEAVARRGLHYMESGA